MSGRTLLRVTKTTTERTKASAGGTAARWAKRVDRLKKSGLSRPYSLTGLTCPPVN